MWRDKGKALLHFGRSSLTTREIALKQRAKCGEVHSDLGRTLLKKMSHPSLSAFDGKSRKLASASWSCSCFSKSRARSLENHESRENFTCRGGPPPPPPPPRVQLPLGRFRYVL